MTIEIYQNELKAVAMACAVKHNMAALNGALEMTPSELKYHVDLTGSPFFTRKSMTFFGDTMKNYGVVKMRIETRQGEIIDAWELFRRRAVKHGLQTSVYFRCDTFKKAFTKQEVEQ